MLRRAAPMPPCHVIVSRQRRRLITRQLYYASAMPIPARLMPPLLRQTSVSRVDAMKMRHDYGRLLPRRYEC